MQPTHSLTVISLGGGVQSSVMALMASQGAFDAIPDCAIFADTHWEPPGLYTRLDWLAERLGFPVYVVDNGRSLREDAKALTNHSGNRNFLDLPVYLKGRDGEGDGMGRRQCIEHYKIAPVRRKMRELLGLSKGQRVPTGTAVELWLGISTDEAIRMRPSRDGWIRNRYPPHRGRDVQEGLHGVVEGTIQQAPGEICLHWLPIPVTAAVGRDQAQVAGAVRRGSGDRRQTQRDGWPSPRSPTCILDGCPSHSLPNPSGCRSVPTSASSRLTACARGTAAPDGAAFTTETAGSLFSELPRRFTAAERRALWQKERRNGSWKRRSQLASSGCSVSSGLRRCVEDCRCRQGLGNPIGECRHDCRVLVDRASHR